jgi:hypothetical protein
MEAAEALRELSKPWPDGDRVKRAIDRAAKLAGLEYWRAFDIWYRKARRVEDYESAAIAKALEEKNILDARNELSELRTRFDRLEASLARRDQDLHREKVDSARPQMHLPR